MAEHVVGNIIALCLVVAAIFVGRFIRCHRLWSDAAQQLWRRRPVALIVIVLYLLVALCDSVTWIGGSASHEDRVAQHKPKSILDRLFTGHEEKSYSSPLSDTAFYGAKALKHPRGHLLGTDILGRDVLYLTLKGARVALLIGGLTSLIAIPLALIFGVAAGYFGRRIDDVVFFLMSTLASMPGILLLVALIMALGRSTLSVCIALGITSWVSFCRLARGETFKLREIDYVQAARVLGVSDFRIIVRHILPNLAHLVVVTFVLMFSGLVLSEAVLSWLGIGVDGSWGQMIAQAKDELSREPIIWWNIAAAGAALFGLLLAVNVVGDAVRDILDPKTVRETL